MHHYIPPFTYSGKLQEPSLHAGQGVGSDGFYRSPTPTHREPAVPPGVSPLLTQGCLHGGCVARAGWDTQAGLEG